MKKRMNRLAMLDMAVNMLNQVRVSHESIERIVDNNEIPLVGFSETNDPYNPLWARYVYDIVRACVGILEINTSDIQTLSKVGLKNQDDNDEEDYEDEND